ncbi:MAG: prepilin peptidase [Rhodospirillales bacterium]|nr:prepilin peptidase [Rhodospirillales bacterium]
MWHFGLDSLASDVLIGSAALLLVLASLRDLATRMVPNGIPLALTAVGILLSALEGRLVWALLAGLIVFSFAFLCWRMRWIGGADVKMLGAGAVLVPPTAAASFVLATGVAGGVLAVIYLLARHFVAAPPPAGTAARRGNVLVRAWRAERWRIHRGCPLPYACAIACGALMMLR